MTSDSGNQATKRQVLAPIGALKHGFYVQHKGDYWLINHRIDNNKIYEKVVVELCNYRLRWIDADGKICEYPAITNDTSKNGIGIAYGSSNLAVGDATKWLILPHNEDKLKLTRDRRLAMGNNSRCPRVYTITKDCNLDYFYGDGGAIFYILDEVAWGDQRDNAELMVADYWKYIKRDTSRYFGAKGSMGSIGIATDFGYETI